MSVFSKVGAVHPGRSVFNLSHERKFDCDMGELIPCYFQECVPGDTFKIGNQLVIRFQPLVAPVLQEINAYVHYFFVPTRLLCDGEHDWEDFISGGVDGQASVTLPRWSTSNGGNAKYSLWDYFGLPANVNGQNQYVPVTPKLLPLSFPKRAYNMIWNEYYMDESLQTPVDIDNNLILHRSWKKDYFTSALPWQQRGVAPALPISGVLPVMFSETTTNWLNVAANPGVKVLPNTGGASGLRLVGNTNGTGTGNTNNGNSLSASVNMAEAVTFNVSDLRLAFQIQKWMERNARGGIRYTEFLKSHFGTSPRDEVLQRPQYIGGTKSPVMISEVLQTSATSNTSPQGNLAGHGLTADQNYVSTYKAHEFGYIVGILSVMPKATYQQGVDASLLRETRYDWYFPEFAHLSERAIKNEELYCDGSNADLDTFGYQGIYNEMRSARSVTCGGMRDMFNYWHLGRVFNSRPNLNGTFLECVPDKRIFAVQDEKGLIVNMANIVKAIRPMPAIGEPGLIDHN